LCEAKSAVLKVFKFSDPLNPLPLKVFAVLPPPWSQADL